MHCKEHIRQNNITAQVTSFEHQLINLQRALVNTDHQHHHHHRHHHHHHHHHHQADEFTSK
jgi:hypothetical protein